MNEVSYYNFCKQIAEDHGIEFTYKYKTYKKSFKTVNGKLKISSSFNSVIVDKEGNEYPYMLSTTQRNNEKLIDFDYIYVNAHKDLSEILKESNIKIKSEPCNICEGGGWYSKGFRYHYKETYCEI